LPNGVQVNVPLVQSGVALLQQNLFSPRQYAWVMSQIPPLEDEDELEELDELLEEELEEATQNAMLCVSVPSLSFKQAWTPSSQTKTSLGSGQSASKPEGITGSLFSLHVGHCPLLELDEEELEEELLDEVGQDTNWGKQLLPIQHSSIELLPKGVQVNVPLVQSGFAPLQQTFWPLEQ